MNYPVSMSWHNLTIELMGRGTIRFQSVHSGLVSLFNSIRVRGVVRCDDMHVVTAIREFRGESIARLRGTIHMWWVRIRCDQHTQLACLVVRHYCITPMRLKAV